MDTEAEKGAVLPKVIQLMKSSTFFPFSYAECTEHLNNPNVSVEYYSLGKLRFFLFQGGVFGKQGFWLKLFQFVSSIYAHHAKVKDKVLNIYVCPWPYLKKIPQREGATIEPLHINSAFTHLITGDTFIYRLHEAERALIHEVVHHTTHIPNQKKLHSIDLLTMNAWPTIPVQCIMTLEAVTELHTLLYVGVYLKKKPLQKYLLEELYFSLDQCVKLYDHFGTWHAWKEKHTTAFSYFVLKTLFLMAICSYKEMYRYVSNKSNHYQLQNIIENMSREQRTGSMRNSKSKRSDNACLTFSSCAVSPLSHRLPSVIL